MRSRHKNNIQSYLYTTTCSHSNMTKHLNAMIILYVLLCLGACKNFKEKLKDQDANAPTETNSSIASYIPYDLTKADQTFVLNKALREVSGLAYNNETKQLIAINDEHGKAYYLNNKDGNIEDEVRFGKKGDYEGVIKVNNYLYAIKSNGYLYEYDLTSKKRKSHKTELTSINEVEGITYEKKKGLLLLACKGKSLDKEISNNTKVIYAFDRESYTLQDKPFITIADTTLLSLIDNKNLNKLSINKLKIRTRLFSPSGISIHPQTGEYYILSARGSTLVICDKQKQPTDIFFLNEKTIPQPEGICFDESGNLFIATEGKGFSGKIFKYTMQ